MYVTTSDEQNTIFNENTSDTWAILLTSKQGQFYCNSILRSPGDTYTQIEVNMTRKIVFPEDVSEVKHMDVQKLSINTTM